MKTVRELKNDLATSISIQRITSRWRGLKQVPLALRGGWSGKNRIMMMEDGQVLKEEKKKGKF